MKIQTRLSGLLFFLLLALCAGSALVVREALLASTRAQAEQIQALRLATGETAARDAAWLGARTLQALVAARLSEVSARAAALAAPPGPAEALAATSPEPLRRVNDALASAGRDLRFQRLVDSRGQIALPPIAPETPWVPPPFSLLEPPALSTTVPLQSLLSQALGGTPVTSIEVFSADMLNHLTQDASAAPTESQPALVLLAIHPVRSALGQASGVIMSGLDLARDTSLLTSWQRQLALEGAGAALLLEGRRIATVGDGLEQGVSLPEDTWKSLQSESEQRLVDPTAAVVRLALRNHNDQAVGAIEVRVPVRTQSLEDAIQADVRRHEQLFQNALSIIGTLGILALIAGILVSRGLVGPLVRLSRKAEKVSTGRLDASFRDMAGKGEVGELARSFERMRVSLKKLMERQEKLLLEEASSEHDRAG